MRMKSMNGQSILNSRTMTASKLSARDICSIIKACNDASVSEIRIGDIHIIFNGAKSPEYLTDAAISPNNGLRSVPSEPVTSEEDVLDQLILSNPSEYEEMVEVTE